MLAKLLTTVAMAAATWLAWRVIGSLTAQAARAKAERQQTPAENAGNAGREDGTISLVKDPETGVYRPTDEPVDR